MQNDTDGQAVIAGGIPDNELEMTRQPAFLYEQIHFDPTGENKTVCYRPSTMLVHFSQFELGVTCYDCLDIIDRETRKPVNERQYSSHYGEVLSGYVIRIE